MTSDHQCPLIEVGPDDLVILGYGDLLERAAGEERGEQLWARMVERYPGLDGRVMTTNAVSVVVVRGGARRADRAG